MSQVLHRWKRDRHHLRLLLHQQWDQWDQLLSPYPSQQLAVRLDGAGAGHEPRSVDPSHQLPYPRNPSQNLK